MNTHFERSQGEYFLSTDAALLQIDRIHRFLSQDAYWCRGIPRDGAAREQVGYARVITDRATFAYIADVYIEAPHRGRGLSKFVMTAIMDYLQPMGLRRICLSTQDAHGLYTRFGLQATPTPGNWMEIKDNELYLKSKPRG